MLIALKWPCARAPQFRFTLLCLAACEAPLLLPLENSEGGEKTFYGQVR